MRLKFEEQQLQIKSLEAKLSEAADTSVMTSSSSVKRNKRQVSRGRPTKTLMPPATPAKSEFAVPSPVKDDREEIIAKFKADNQMLMRRLSEYKKAEKNAMDLVKDYA